MTQFCDLCVSNYPILATIEQTMFNLFPAQYFNHAHTQLGNDIFRLFLNLVH